MTAYLVPSRANTERKAVMTRNQVTTLTSGPWFSEVSQSGASVFVKLEMVLIMPQATGRRRIDTEVLRYECQHQVLIGRQCLHIVDRVGQEAVPQ